MSDPPGAGREQLLLVSLELQTRLGVKHCDETELTGLLFTHSLVRRVRTIDVEVRVSDGGSSFKITISAAETTVGEAKKEIARVLNRSATRQELYKCEDCVDAEKLDDSAELKDGEVVSLVVNKLSSDDETSDKYIRLRVMNQDGDECMVKMDKKMTIHVWSKWRRR
jgi:hypothetical protein